MNRLLVALAAATATVPAVAGATSAPPDSGAAPTATVTLEGAPRWPRALAGWTEGLVAQALILCGGEEVASTVSDGDGGRVVVELAWALRR